MLVSESDKQATGSYELSFYNIAKSNALILTNGTTRTDQNTNCTETIFYTFQAEAGDQIKINFRKKTGISSVDFKVEIFNASDLSKSIKIERAISSSREIDLPITESGTYYMLVSESDKQATGSYELSFYNIAKSNALILTNGTTRTDQNTNCTETIFYTFQAEAGDQIKINFRKKTGISSVDFKVEIFNASDLSKSIKIERAISSSREIDLPITESGTYYMLVSESDKQATGSYELSFYNIAKSNALILTNGTTRTDQNTNCTETIFYTFQAEAGDQIKINFRKKTGISSVDFKVEIFNASDLSKSIKIERAISSSREIDLPITESGTYYMLVSESDKQATGSYELSFYNIAKSNALILTNGTTRTDQNTNCTETIFYTFQAEAGDQIKINFRKKTGISSVDFQG